VFPGYDQSSVPSVPNANIVEIGLWLADPSDIFTEQWEKSTGQTGIKMQFINKDVVNGIPSSAFSLAPANPDGTPGSYLTAGAPIYLSDIKGVSTTTSGVSAGATTINVADGTQFASGGYALIGDDITQEEIWITGISGNVLTIAVGTANAYLSGTNVYDNGRKVWGKVVIPLASGAPISWINVAMDVTFDGVSRV
jgi:hypothetical protein